MSDKYILDGHIPVECDDSVIWADFIENIEGRRVAYDIIDGVIISTIFLGLDHSFDEEAPPLLFETLIFGGEHDDDMQRYTTWERAEQGHKEMVERVKNAENTG